jgi:hypothetical protein
MTVYKTDKNKKLIKVAGNFNPSYEVSQLVAEKTITTPTNLITIDNLDIKADGGVYDFVLSGYNTAHQENIIKFQIGYNKTAFTSNRYYHQFMASYDAIVYAGKSQGSGYSTIGVFAQNPSSITGSISLFENFAQGKTQSFDVQNSNQILICGFGYYDTVPNITELYFGIDTTFAVGTTVKIYKRMANATTMDGKLVADQITAGATLTNQNDTVVESYVSSDGKTWYRKWASGWKECGGYVTVKQNTEFVIPVTFSTNLWTALATVVVTGGESMSSIIIQTLKYSNYCALKVSSGVQTIAWYQNDIKYYCCGF